MKERVCGLTMEQRVYDLMQSCGGTMLAHDIGRALNLTKDQFSGCGSRLSKRGIIKRWGATWGSKWEIIGERPSDRRGQMEGSKSRRYGGVLFGVAKVNAPGNNLRRRGPNLPKPSGALWDVWRPSPCLHADFSCGPITGGTVRPQET